MSVKSIVLEKATVGRYLGAWLVVLMGTLVTNAVRGNHTGASCGRHSLQWPFLTGAAGLLNTRRPGISNLAERRPSATSGYPTSSGQRSRH